MFWTEGNGAGGTAQGAGTAGAQGAETGAANSQTGTGNGGAQGAATADLVPRSEFTALSSKLDKVLSENADYRKRLRQLVTGEDDDDSGKGGKPDKNAEKLDKALAAARQDRFTAQVTTAAVKLGAPFPEQVVALLRIDDVADELGAVKDVDKVVADLKQKYPNIFAPAQQGYGDINGGSGGGNNRKRTAADVNREIRSFRRGRDLKTG